MSGLLKADAAELGEHPILPFGMLRPEAQSEASPDVHLEERIAALEALLERRQEEHAEALAAAREEAASEALEQRSDAEDRSIELLRAALEEAGTAWRSRLESWHGAAAGICSALLKKLFDDMATGPLAPMIESAIRRRLAGLDERSLVAIRVSVRDFPDEDRLAAAAAAVGGHVRLIADSSLERGGCEVDLKLGHIDLALGQQWRRIEALLARLEAEGNEP